MGWFAARRSSAVSCGQFKTPQGKIAGPPSQFDHKLMSQTLQVPRISPNCLCIVPPNFKLGDDYSKSSPACQQLSVGLWTELSDQMPNRFLSRTHETIHRKG